MNSGELHLVVRYSYRVEVIQMRPVKPAKKGETRSIQALNDLAKKIGKLLGTSAELATEVPGLMLYRQRS